MSVLPAFRKQGSGTGRVTGLKDRIPLPALLLLPPLFLSLFFCSFGRSRRQNLFHRVLRNSDITDLQPACVISTLSLIMAEFGQSKSHSQGRMKGRAQNRSRVGADAAGNVHRQHRNSKGIQPKKDLSHIRPHFSLQADSKKGIQDQIRRSAPGFLFRILCFLLPVLKQKPCFPEPLFHQARIRCQLLTASHQKSADLHPFLCQKTGRCHAVAAVIARSAEDSDPKRLPLLSFLQKRQCFFRCMAGCPFHQNRRRYLPLFDCHPVYLFHLRR